MHRSNLRILLLFQNTVELHHSKPLRPWTSLQDCCFRTVWWTHPWPPTGQLARWRHVCSLTIFGCQSFLEYNYTTVTTHLKHTQTHSFPVFCLIFRAWFMISIGTMLVVLCFLLIFLLLALLCLCANVFTKNWGLRPTCLFYFTQDLETNIQIGHMNQKPTSWIMNISLSNVQYHL